MFWWQDPEERTFEAASGIIIATLETHETTLYRVTLLQPVLRPRQDRDDLVGNDEAEV